MNLPTRCMRLVMFAVLTMRAATIQAGGPMFVGSPTFGVDGQPFVWDNTKPIQYRTDGGPLGSLSNSSANDLVAEAFRTWANVPTASLSFTRAGSITGIADGNVNTIAEFDAALGSCYAGTQTPVIYDDATLLWQLTGDESVVGLAGPCSLTPEGKIQAGFAIFGKPSTLESALLPAVIVHELGHLIGLDHTDIGIPWATGTTQEDVDATPTMAPLLNTPLQSSLGVDDISWISKLYPSASFAASYGRITGRVLFSDGKSPAQGALVVARATNDIHVTVVSGVAGYRFTTNPGQSQTKDYLPCTPVTSCSGGSLGDNTAGSQFGSRDPFLIGFYELSVPPGQYTVEVRLLFAGYSGFGVEGSGPMFPLPGPPEPWNTNESANDGDAYTDTSPGVVTVAAGETVNDIDVILNGTDPTFDIFERSQSGSTREWHGREKTIYTWRSEPRTSGDYR